MIIRLIIFMGDNGYFQGEHQLADKWYPYEESIRIPLVVKDTEDAGENKRFGQLTNWS